MNNKKLVSFITFILAIYGILYIYSVIGNIINVKIENIDIFKIIFNISILIFIPLMFFVCYRFKLNMKIFKTIFIVGCFLSFITNIGFNLNLGLVLSAGKKLSYLLLVVMALYKIKFAKIDNVKIFAIITFCFTGAEFTFRMTNMIANYSVNELITIIIAIVYFIYTSLSILFFYRLSE